MPGKKDETDHKADELRSAYRGKQPDEYDARLDAELAAMDEPPPPLTTRKGAGAFVTSYLGRRAVSVLAAGGIMLLRGGSGWAVLGGMACVLVAGGFLTYVWQSTRERARQAEDVDDGE